MKMKMKIDFEILLFGGSYQTNLTDSFIEFYISITYNNDEKDDSNVDVIIDSQQMKPQLIDDENGAISTIKLHMKKIFAI